MSRNCSAIPFVGLSGNRVGRPGSEPIEDRAATARPGAWRRWRRSDLFTKSVQSVARSSRLGVDKLNRLCARAAYRGEVISKPELPDRANRSKKSQENTLCRNSRGRSPSRSDVRSRGALHRALVSGAASALLVGLGVSAEAAPRGGFFSPYGWYGYYSYPAQVPSRRLRAAPARRERAEPNKEVGFGEMPKGPLQIVVSIDHQRVTLFSNGVRVAQGPVSTGVPGHPTPMGVFSIIEKDRYHRSNLYSNAPMPFMQRITWSGVALHEGVLPGYPASHGCIRMSRDFAQKLWPTTKLGARVIVARGELAPVDFEHPKLFVPKPKPGEPEVAVNATTDGYRAAPITIAQATMPDAREGATATAAEVAAEPMQSGARRHRQRSRRPPPSRARPRTRLPAATSSNPRPRSIRPSRSRRACGRPSSRSSEAVRWRSSSAARK